MYSLAKLSRRAVLVAFAATMAAPPAFAQDGAKVDPKLRPYKTTSGVSGNLNSIGSDTLNNLMTLWAESFRKRYPSVRIQIEGKGSSTAPPALIKGTSQIGPMSRKMKAEEIDEFEKAFGYKPIAIPVAIDALAVFVNKDNPVGELTLQQVDAIFSKNRKAGAATDIASWGDVGLTGSWAAKPISLYGRNSASGTYAYFQKVALAKGDYKATVKEQPGSASVVNGITEDLYGIGYSGIGYKTSGVKTVALAKKPGGAFVAATPKEALSGKYPLARQLYVYVNKHPRKPLDPILAEFIRFVLSREGQTIVVKDGYIPLPSKLAARSLAAIEGKKVASR